MAASVALTRGTGAALQGPRREPFSFGRPPFLPVVLCGAFLRPPYAESPCSFSASALRFAAGLVLTHVLTAAPIGETAPRVAETGVPD